MDVRRNVPSLRASRTSYVISNCSGLVNGAGLSRTLTSKISTAAMKRLERKEAER